MDILKFRSATVGLLATIMLLLSQNITAQDVAPEQKNYRDENRSVIYISYSSIFLDKAFDPTTNGLMPDRVVYEEIPYVQDSRIIMNCSELGIERFIHPIRRSGMFLSLGTRMQISKGSVRIGDLTPFINEISSFKIVTPLCIGYDKVCKGNLTISPSVGAVIRYNASLSDTYTRDGFGNYMISKKFDVEDGLNRFQYGLRAGIDISGHIITMGVHYTIDRNPLFDCMGVEHSNEGDSYYGIKGHTSDLQVKFGFIIR